MKIRANRMLVGERLVTDRLVTVSDGTIAGVEAYAGGACDVSLDILTPGLIDLHCHGGEGFSAYEADPRRSAAFLDRMLRAGVTDHLLTLSAAPIPVMRQGLAFAREAMAQQADGRLGGSRIRGVHLEGPFLSGARAGAMPADAILPPSAESYRAYFGDYDDIVRLVTLAPEEEGAEGLMAWLKGRGIRVQAGHTDATYDQAVRAFGGGAESLCHSFNACRGIHHREPGVVMAAMECPAVYMEAICDLQHLHPAILRLICREKGTGRMILISDSTAVHGLPDGAYLSEGTPVRVQDGVARTLSGALDGGGVYLDEAVRNMVSIGIPLPHALCMASVTPAKRMRWTQLGDIRPGMAARLVGWSGALRPVWVMADGHAVALEMA